MIAHVILAVTMLLPSAQQQTEYCRKAEQDRDLNLPPTDISDATDIVHMSVIYRGGRFIGYLYGTRNGVTFFALGGIGSTKGLVGSLDAEYVTHWLRVRDIPGFQQLGRLHPGAVPLTAGKGVNLLGCY